MRWNPDRMLSAMQARLARRAGHDAPLRLDTPASGGQINASAVLRQGDKRYFLKLNSPGRLVMFEAEREGLLELAGARCIEVPEPVLCGTAGGRSFLLLEYLELSGRGEPAELGRKLAALHAVTGERFGWKMDNTIGLTPQVNTPGDDWIAFWRLHRLEFQFDLAAQNGYAGALRSAGDRLLAGLAGLFAGYAPVPSLLHGDLWSGNHGYRPDGTPVIFDPAVYYGDRETDLAMTELFGGFGKTFYDAYRDAWPLDPGYDTRKWLYQLYHVLNHLNLFGPAYLAQAETLTARLLAELG